MCSECSLKNFWAVQNCELRLKYSWFTLFLSAAQGSDSSYTRIYVLFILLYHRVLSTAFRAVCLSHTQQLHLLTHKPPLFPSPNSLLSNHTSVLYGCNICFVDMFTCVIFYIPHESYHPAFVLLWLTSRTMIISRSIHGAVNGIVLLPLYGLVLHCMNTLHLHPFTCWRHWVSFPGSATVAAPMRLPPTV